MIYVPGNGNPSAKLMIVGEAPGADEERLKEPFVGPSGRIVDECLATAGMDRSQVYVTNVCKIRPPHNEIHRLGELGVSIEDYIPQLWKEVETINPNCILAFGNVALKALTGQTGIQKYRGSIIANSRTVYPKVVASIHPASLFHADDGKMRSYRDRAFIQFDVNRAVAQSAFREIRHPQRNLLIAHSSLDFIRFMERLGQRRVLSMDIETYKCIPMCIGFALSKHEAISVPLFNQMSSQNPTGMSKNDIVHLWKMIADVLMDPQWKLIGHNLKFDQGRLDDIGFEMQWPYFDTQLGFHTMYPELPKKLQFVSSILTEEPYYKDELEEYSPKKDKLEKRLIYNCKDCVVTYEVYEKEIAELKEMGMLEWYFDHQPKLHKFYYNMERRGINIDKTIRKFLIKKYDRYTALLHHTITRDLGYELNVASPKQVATTLFGDLKCPVRKDTAEETLEMLMLNSVKDDRRRRIIGNILKERKSRKTSSTYVKAKLWPDGRIRTVVNITGTESGRTSTSKPKQPVTIEPMGVAFQTLTKHGDVGSDLRRMYIPSEGKILFEADLSQAEARVVALLARDQFSMDLMNKTNFKRNKFGIKDDIHTLTTIWVTGADFEAIDDELRQIGKKTRHAGNYGMGKRRLSLLAQISEWKAGQCLIKFHDEAPRIKSVFWQEVQAALERDSMVLTAPNGRRRSFFDKWGDDLFKEAYAFIPQCTVSDHLKFAAIAIEEEAPWIEMLEESHDSFLAEIPPDRLQEAAAITRRHLEVPIDFSRCSLPREPLVIPCDMQVGYKNWKEMSKFRMEDGIAA